MSLSRRAFIQRALALGLGSGGAGAVLAAWLAGCGSPSSTATAVAAAPTAAPTRLPATPPPAATATVAPTTTRAAAATVAPTSPPAATATVAPTTPTDVPTAPPATAAPTVAPAAGQAYLAAVRGADPAAITERALAALGGIERFVRPGYDVIVKPNICNAYHSAEYASTTNPDVVATLVRLCLAAGAKRVRVMDSPFGGSPKEAYKTSGIQAAVEAAGGEMELMSRLRFKDTPIPQGQLLKNWAVYQDALDADLLINVPIAKTHGLARLTLGGKNLMGLIQRREPIHGSMGQKLADLATLFRPALTVVDCVRILVANGPTGGNLDDVKQTNLVIASHDMVAADAYATRLFDLTPDDVAYIPASAAMGLGTTDLSAVRVAELDL